MPARARLPLFPLADFVLFPSVRAPLHIFEPRYRQMAEAALEGDGVIGMVTVQPAHAEEMAGNPPIFPVGCAGSIVEHRKLPDGRFYLVLEGSERFRIESEIPPEGERLYRVGEVELLPDPLEPVDEVRVMALRERVIELFGRLAERSADGERLDPARLEAIDDIRMVNTLCHALDLETLEKQGLLEAVSVPQRYERLAGLLRFRLAQADAGGAPGSQVLH